MKPVSSLLVLNVEKTRKADFMEQLVRVVLWAELVALISLTTQRA